MKYDPACHHRRSIRLKGYDYSRAGAYFITLCAQDRQCLFGEVLDGVMRLNDAGRMVVTEWERLPERFPNVVLDAFVVMPNHVHGIIVITDAIPVGAGLVPAQNKRATTRVAPTVGDDRVTTRVAPTVGDDRATTRVAPTVGEIIGAYKSVTTVVYTRGVKQFGWPAFRTRLWQRNYYEHIIRDDESLNRIREYITNNPMQWELDRENPKFVGAGFQPASTGNEPWRI
jgi:REP element-mobilizing transposase RayT